VGRSNAIREQLISSFRAELADHVQTMTDGLLALEQGRLAGDRRQLTLEAIFRAAHSLKGAARAVNVTVVEQLAHSLEGVLDAIQLGMLKPTAELYTACYRALDAIQAVQAAYEAGETTPPMEAVIALTELEALRSEPDAVQQKGTRPSPVQGTIPVRDARAPSEPIWASVHEPSAGDETIRVSVAKLDALMAQFSELLIARMRAEQRLGQMRKIQRSVTRWQRDWMSPQRAHSRINRQRVDADSVGHGQNGKQRDKEVTHLLDRVGTAQERLREIGILVNDLTRQYTSDTMHMSLVVDGLEEEIKRVRMRPLSTLTGPLGRMVRDLARAAGKEAVLQTAGDETELDKQVLERIKDPLIHLLRNAIDHGIEPPEEREALGKPRAGTITLTAEQQGQDVVVRVSDDGAGLDMDALQAAIVRQGRANAQSLSNSELENLIFTTGISTSPIITDISGRGIGLSVVRQNVEALRGHVGVDWSPGSGTTFALTLPLTLTSTRGLVVRVSDQPFVIPLNTVEQILAVAPDDIFSLEGQDTIRNAEHPVTLVRLDDLLDLPHIATRGRDRDIPIVLVTAAERRMGLVVEELVGEQEVVVKGLGKQLAHVGGIGGATVLGSGEVVLILSVADLIKLAMRGEPRPVLDARPQPAPQAQLRAQRRILVVDDSITTRTLEKNILEAVGYSVELATDGQEALSAIGTSGVPDLVVSDILMPRMDGFELTQRLKGDEHTAHVPVILISSLDSPADKTRGIEVGADAYIVKNRFEQGNLLETIEQLI
jgi:two-component system chemotaxis sensor kinase CheA